MPDAPPPIANLVQFDLQMLEVKNMIKQANKLLTEARHLEDYVLCDAGIESIDREPGFPCWQIKGVSGWFASPRDAIKAKDGQNNE